MKDLKVTGAHHKVLQILSRKDISAIQKNPKLVAGAKHLLLACKKTNLPVAERLDRAHRMARPTGVGQTIAAIIATTRREWMSQGRASPAPDEAGVDRARFAHPLIRIALDATRSSSWRARADRQERIQSVDRFADLDRTPSGAGQRQPRDTAGRGTTRPRR